MMDETVGYPELDAANTRDGHYARKGTPARRAAELKARAWQVWDKLVDLKYREDFPSYIRAAQLERELAKAVNSGDALQASATLETVKAYFEVTVQDAEWTLTCRMLAEDYAATMTTDQPAQTTGREFAITI